MRDDDFNPYEAPEHVEPAGDAACPDGVAPGLPVLPRTHWKRLRFHVDDVERRWWTRTIRISGSVTAWIRYEAMGIGERVLVDDRVAGRSTQDFALFQLVTPFIDFELVTDNWRIPARVDVRVSLFRAFKLTKFQLTIADTLVYLE